MKKILLTIPMLLLLGSCSLYKCDENCVTLKIEKERIRIEQQNKDREHQLEMMRIRSEINANKPVEVRVQEIKNQDFGTAEAITTVGVVGAVGYGLWQIMK